MILHPERSTIAIPHIGAIKVMRVEVDPLLLALHSVGMTGFEPATTRPPDEYSNRAELHPECSWRLTTWALSLLRCKDKEKVANYQMSREENQALP